MTTKVDTVLRGPDSYSLARRAIEEMESAGVWPTPVNFELWLHYLDNPGSALSDEIRRLLAAREPFSDATSELLATEHLPRGQLTEQIRDAGRVLDNELSSVAEAISDAHKSSVAYGVTLADASQSMETSGDPAQLKVLVSGLSTATKRVKLQNASLEKRLETSTQEVVRLREHLEQVRRDAMTDALTNLANRKAFDEYLESACTQARNTGGSLALAVIDIDHFKRFNDTWGHQTGDQVLRYVASVMARIASEPRFAARYGGEEFTIIFPAEAIDSVEAALEDIRKEIGSRGLRRRSTNDELGAVTISIGVAELSEGEKATALLERADSALYASKHGGRNRLTRAETLDRAAA
ncbi:GGDEF domain-containing protein [uncultured Brevundimonas sp.]|uniref:GGDEF domain-containing protein n=1 Tax=uncultured Brevundimonas sp. TaxID=213418 RepID=UPI0030EF936E|tara:strand:- start:249 stop:1307 length:1059 start_codon:yes stop_codon:yes gene_type:complete